MKPDLVLMYIPSTFAVHALNDTPESRGWEDFKAALGSSDLGAGDDLARGWWGKQLEVCCPLHLSLSLSVSLSLSHTHTPTHAHTRTHTLSLALSDSLSLSLTLSLSL